MNRISWLALIALAEGHLPSFEVTRANHSRQWPDGPALKLSQQTSSLITYASGDSCGTFALVPQPIAWSQLEGPCAVAWYWPTAAETLRDHQHHLMVAQVDEGRRTVGACLHFTSIVASVLDASRALGVLWGPAAKVHEPSAFVGVARQMSPENLPLDLWIDFRIEPTERDRLRLFTTGMSAFDYPELEVDRYAGSAEELFRHAYNIAHMQLEKATTIRDGDTFGMTDEVQATARVGPSLIDPGQEVTHLQFE